MSPGTSVAGPTSVIFAPSFASPWMFERATREFAMSPTIATCKLLECVQRSSHCREMLRAS